MTSREPPATGDPAIPLMAAVGRMAENIDALVHDVRGEFVRESAGAAISEIARAVDRLVIQRYRWAIVTAAAIAVLNLAIGAVAGYWFCIATIKCAEQSNGARVCGWYERLPNIRP